MKKKKKDSNLLVINIIIHGFTVAHGSVALTLGPAAGTILAPMTAAMVLASGVHCRAKFSAANVLRIMSNFIGFILGVSVAEFLVGLFPGIGNAANAITTVFVTELLGWATYIVLRDNLDEKRHVSMWGLLWEALSLRRDNQEYIQKIKQAREKMNDDDRKTYDDLMKTVIDKNTAEEDRKSALEKARALLRQHGLEE